MIARRGISTGPLYTGIFVHHATQCGSEDDPATDDHSDYAAFKRNLAITMACGKTAGQYHEPWATRCPDPKAWTAYIDIFYNGTRVYRDVFVAVDGERCYLPIPRDLDDLRVARAEVQLTALLSTLSLGQSNYDLYLRRTGLQLVNLPWPQSG